MMTLNSPVRHSSRLGQRHRKHGCRTGWQSAAWYDQVASCGGWV